MDIVQGVISQRVNTLIDIVIAQITREVELSRDFKDNLNKLMKRLEMINNIILANCSSADVDEASTGAVQLWLRDVEGIAYDAENMLDVLAFEKVRQKLVKKLSFSKRVHSLFSPSNPVLFRRNIGRWIRRIDSAIQEVYLDAHTLGLRPADLPSSHGGSSADTGDSNSSHHSVLQETRDIPDTSFVVGRADDKATILKHVLCNTGTTVVAIVGLGGLGKTVLAQEVYEDEQVKLHFSERIWIIVSREFKIEKILNDMVGFIKKTKYNCNNVHLTVQTLSDLLFGKRYLLVLDDVWNTRQDTWDTLQNALRRISGSADAKILVTTRDRGVADTMHTSLIHRLPELSPEDSWSLFKRSAFADWPPDHASVMEEIGRRIVNKCRGLPLAIKTIAGLLNAKKRAYEWMILEKSAAWNAPQDQAGILPSLNLSYTYLPTPFLKKCFSLLAIYPKGYIWLDKSLILMWMANGFVQQPRDGSLTMEDIAEEYISNLLRISFLQEHKRNELGEITHFTMHDLVHDLATYVGKHECLCLDLNVKDIQEHNVEKSKHLLLTGENLEVSDALVFGNLRTLVSFRSFPTGILLHAKYLRSLLLADMNLEEVPESIVGWKCLKYLDLSYNPIKARPGSIMKLYNLQSLWLDRCNNLNRIPEGLGDLVNLRHFWVDRFLELPVGVEQLTRVQTLPPLCVRDGGFQIAELRDLHDVSGILHIGGLELVTSKQDAEKANLSEKSRVQMLGLHWRNSRQDHSKDMDEQVLDGLYPNSHLRHLYIRGYGSKKFPEWVMKMDVARGGNPHPQAQRLLCNLTKIELVNCTRCEQLPTMGHLPCLKFLKISEMESLKRIGKELYCCEEDFITGTSSSPNGSTEAPVVCFPRLEELELNHLDSLEEWCELEPPLVCFPRLALLIVEFCANLRNTPTNFPSLKSVTAKGISSSLPVKRIIGNNTTLHALEIKEVEELENLPEELTQCTSLRRLAVLSCPMLTFLPDLSGLTSLREFSIFNNDSLRCPPSGLKSCTSLEFLRFNKCCKSKAITEDLSGLSRLSQLGITSQTELITKPPQWLLNSLPCLQELSIGRYVELDHFPDMSPLLNITSLVRLFLVGWPKLESQTLPNQLQHFNRLTSLAIYLFIDMEALPEWLGNLSSLERLGVYNCRKLKSLASMDAMKRLAKLCFLDVCLCPLLAESVKANGAEHNKVAHIQVNFPKPEDVGLKPPYE